jgi:osmotically-inducible protein OsmY
MKLLALFFSGLIFCCATIASPSTLSGAQAEELTIRVKDALHSDRYFYDAHVEVFIEKGAVVLRGLVFDDWDLRNALHIAKTAAGDRRVINELTLVQGGRR